MFSIYLFSFCREKKTHSHTHTSLVSLEYVIMTLHTVSNLRLSYQSTDGFCVFCSDCRVLTFIAFKSFALLGTV